VVALLKKVLNEELSFNELLDAYNITLTYASLSGAFAGFVYADPSGKYLVVINDNLSFETKQKVFLHELKHIIFDLPKASYFVGIDVHNSPLEQETDKLVNEILKNLQKEAQ